MGSYRIISVDGGGIRGILSIRLLQRMCKEVPGLLEATNFLAGTSTGAIVCLCLASGMSINELYEWYYSKAQYIFSRTAFRHAGLQTVAAKYDNEMLKSMLKKILGNVQLGELRKSVLISAFDLDTYDGNGRRMYKTKFFHNLNKGSEDSKRNAVDVALYSSAAPTYFPSHGGYVDGGLVANNPSMAAVASALDPDTVPTVCLDDIKVLSLGTGKVAAYIEGDRLDWGFARWATKLVDVMMNGSVDIADYECRQILRERYTRMNPYLDGNFKLDDTGAIDKMIDLADSYDITKHIEWARNVYMFGVTKDVDKI